MPAINEQHTIIVSVLANLVRRHYSDAEKFLLVAPGYELNPHIITEPLSMSVYIAKAQMLKLVPGAGPVEDEIRLIGQDLLSHNIKALTIEMVLHKDFLTRLNILTQIFEFDIDAALRLMRALSTQELEQLPYISSIPFIQFNALFYILYENNRAHPFNTTLTKILAIVEGVDAELKPWHIKTLFNSTLLNHQFVADKRRTAAHIEDQRGVDQCQRNSMRLTQRAYPKVVVAFTTALRYDVEEATRLVSRISEFNVDDVADLLQIEWRRLIRECIYMAKTYNTTTQVIHKDILRINDGLSSRFNSDGDYLDRIDSFPIQRWFVPFISPALFELMNDVVLKIDNSHVTSKKYFNAVDELFLAYDASIKPAFEASICKEIFTTVSEAKLQLYQSVEIYKILAADKYIPNLMLSNIATSIALDYLSCGANFYDYEHSSLQYFILRNYEAIHQFSVTQVASVPTHILMPRELENELNLEDLTARQQKMTASAYFAKEFSLYAEKERKFKVQNNRNHQPAAGRRLFEAGITKPVDDSAEKLQAPGFLSNLIYRFFGKPLLNIIKESPTYFPPTQPDLWTGTESNNDPDLYQPLPSSDNVTQLINAGFTRMLSR